MKVAAKNTKECPSDLQDEFISLALSIDTCFIRYINEEKQVAMYRKDKTLLPYLHKDAIKLLNLTKQESEFQLKKIKGNIYIL